MSEKQTSPEEKAAYLAECRELPDCSFDRALAIWSKAYREQFWTVQKPSPRLPEARSAEVRFFLDERVQSKLVGYMPLFFRFVEDPSTATTFIDAEWHKEHPRNMTFIQDGLKAKASSYSTLRPLQKAAEALVEGKKLEESSLLIRRSVVCVLDDNPVQLSEAILLLLKTGLSIEKAVDAMTNQGEDPINYPTLTAALIAARIKDEFVVKALEVNLKNDHRGDTEVARQIIHGFDMIGIYSPERTLTALKTAGWDEARIKAATSWIKPRP